MSPRNAAPQTPVISSLSRGIFFAVILLFPAMDLLLAALYQATGNVQVIWLRYARDVSCLLLAAGAFLDPRMPYTLRLSATCYGLFVSVYALAGLVFNVAPFRVVIASLGTLVIPVSLPFAAFYAIRTAQDMRKLVTILCLYAAASALFGLWEIDHTEFWTAGVAMGRYVWDVKGITTGFEPESFLPWNFYGLDQTRRAAGLLAAPLAQGFFLAVVGLVGFAFLRGRSLVLAMQLYALCFYGAVMSGTRGALLALTIGSLGYFLYPARDKRTRRINLALITLVAVLAAPVLVHYVLYTVRLEDNSTIGHLRAVEMNVRDIGEVLLFGSGVAAAGGQASSVGLSIEGGGEGALFSVSYQLGVPGACVCLWFLMQLFLHCFAGRHEPGTRGELSRALSFLFLGVSLSLVMSEHLLTFSGMGAFWFLLGGYIGYLRRNPVVRSVTEITPGVFTDPA